MADESLTVLAGHGRAQAGQQIGLQEVPIIRLAHLSGAQARAFSIGDNRLTDNSTWDDRLLGEIFRDLSAVELEFKLGRSARTVVIAEALSEGRIREWFFAGVVTRRILQALPVQIDDIALEPSVVGQHLPRQRMVAFAKP